MIPKLHLPKRCSLSDETTQKTFNFSSNKNSLVRTSVLLYVEKAHHTHSPSPWFPKPGWSGSGKQRNPPKPSKNTAVCLSSVATPSFTSKHGDQKLRTRFRASMTVHMEPSLRVIPDWVLASPNFGYYREGSWEHRNLVTALLAAIKAWP